MGQRGLFITFEGTEGSGKTTLIQRLSAAFTEAGYAVCTTHEPGGTPISQQIREILLSPNRREMAWKTELLLFAAARSQHVAEVIAPALEAGKIVISDRFSDSTVAYQGYGRGLDVDMIQRLNHLVTDGLSPDVTFLLDVPVEIGLERVKQARGSLDRLELERLEFHRRVRAGYLAIASQEPYRVKIIDAQMSPARIYESLKTELDAFLRMKGIERQIYTAGGHK